MSHSLSIWSKDVGSLYWIPRLTKGGIGLYLALTGARLKADDLLYSGIATHYVPSAKLNDLKESLIESSLVDSGMDDIAKDVLSSFHQDIPTHQSFLFHNKDVIDQIFLDKKSVEEIFTALGQHESIFATNTLSTLRKMSPTSLKVTFEGLHRSSLLSTMSDGLKMEYRLSQRFMQPGSDFYDGVRAVLVDKDHRPKWNPPTLDLVTAKEVDSYFADLGCHDLDIVAAAKV